MNPETLRDPSFWAALDPGDSATHPPRPMSDGATSSALAQLEADGFARGGVVLDADHIARLRATLDAVASAGLPHVFAFAFEHVWAAFDGLAPLLSRALGDDYRRLPCFWAFHVDTGESGWGPHRDRTDGSLFPDGRPKSLSTWIALTEANPDNGCIYVMRGVDNTFEGHVERDIRLVDLIDVHALPAVPGELLMWNQAVLHWGGRAGVAAREPRISLSFEFQRGDVPAFEEPLLDALRSPSLDTRLALIGKQIGQYAHMHREWGPLLPIARALSELDPAVGWRGPEIAP